MFRAVKHFILPIAATVCLGFGALHAYWHARPQPRLAPPVNPASSRFSHTVAATGIVEPQFENISVGSSQPGIVVEVFVKTGQKVRAGEPLFRIDDRELRAQLACRESDCEQARAQLLRLSSTPRPEALPEARARVAEADVRLADALDQYQRGKTLSARCSIPSEQLTARERAYRIAEAQSNQAKAQLALLAAGAWAPDVEVAQRTVQQAEAQIALAKTELDRLVVRALADGEVLQLNVRPGGYVGPTNNRAPVVLGNVDVLHLRVSIDEEDIPRFQRSGAATAEIRGSTGRQYPLHLVRVEPLVVNKQSLTGNGAERVDVRVLQAVYAIDAPASDIFVGQQLDVFIDASPTTAERETGLTATHPGLPAAERASAPSG
jgi:HlyD family secretion protein